MSTSTKQIVGQGRDRNQAATVWIGNLDDKVTEALLWELMVQVGPTLDVSMPTDKITGQHNNYAFCEFRHEYDAEYAIKVMNQVKLFGKPIRINKSSRDHDDEDVGANLFVGNLDRDIDEQYLYNMFSAFGHVLTAKIMLDEANQSRGFGFVNFASFTHSDAALAAMNGQYILNKPLHVSYAYKRDGGSSGAQHGTEAERVLALSREAAAAASTTH